MKLVFSIASQRPILNIAFLASFAQKMDSQPASIPGVGMRVIIGII